jgi:hypothetical protein
MITAYAIAIVVGLGAQGSAPLRVVGNHVEAGGKRVHLRGVNVCGMEWNGHGENVARSVPIAYDDWHANIVRLPLCQDRWFGKTDDSPDGGAPYRAIVDQVVQEAGERSKYVLLDLHWSDCDQWGQDISQHTLPDENSLAFWKDCAARYKNNPSVLFDLYNEPIDAPWKVWCDGGEVTEHFQGKTLTYKAVGLQTLLDAIRGVGARNLIVAGGLGYASRLDFTDEIKLKDPEGQGVVYVSHFYPGWENTASWEKRVVAFRKRGLPLIVSEFGAGPGQGAAQEAAHRATSVLAILRKYDLDWIAWCLHPEAGPSLIKNWNYEPTPYFGVYVKAALAGRAVPIEPRAESAPDMHVYHERLVGEWQYWGNATVDFACSTVVRSGTKSMQVDMAENQRLQLGCVPFDGNAYKSVSFWLNGGAAGGQRLILQASVMDVTQEEEVQLPALKANEWTQVVVSFHDLGIEGKEDVKSFTIRLASGVAAKFYVDDIVIRGKP